MPNYPALAAFMLLGIASIKIAWALDFLGIEWIQAQIERVIKRVLTGRNNDDNDPRGDFGGGLA